VAADRSENARNFCGGADVLAENQRGEKSTNDKPGGFVRFGVEEGTFRGGDFASAGEAVGKKFDEDDRTIAGDAKAGFKRRLETHLELAKGDRLNVHGFSERSNDRL
jgi:hypothetical protein